MIIFWRAPFFDPSGYGSAARQYILALNKIKADFRVIISNHYYSNIVDDKLLEQIPDDIKNAILPKILTKYPPESQRKNIVFVDHRTPNIFQILPGVKLNIGYTVCETNDITIESIKRCNDKNAIWTASKYSADSFIASGVECPVNILPHVVDTNFFNPNVKPLNLKNKKDFVFLANFDWHKRKGYDILFKAYYKAFKHNDNVCLLLKTCKFDTLFQKDIHIKEYISKLKREMGIDKAPVIMPFYKIVKFDLLPSLYTVANAFVTATRGEAWGLPISEAMACELPVIVPSIGGQRDFCKDDNSIIVKSEFAEIQKGEVEKSRSEAYKQGQKWVETDVDELAKAMRYVYDNYELSKKRAINGRKFLEQNFNYEKIGNLILKYINNLIPSENNISSIPVID